MLNYYNIQLQGGILKQIFNQYWNSNFCIVHHLQQEFNFCSPCRLLSTFNITPTRTLMAFAGVTNAHGPSLLSTLQSCSVVKRLKQFIYFQQEEGWLMGVRATTGQKGMFPANFTRPIQRNLLAKSCHKIYSYLHTYNYQRTKNLQFLFLCFFIIKKSTIFCFDFYLQVADTILTYAFWSLPREK